MEVVGYIFRTLSAKQDPYNIIYFVVEYFLIVTAPVFISATIYVCLSKLVALETSRPVQAAFRPQVLLWTFISFDVMTTIMQITGAAIIGTSESKHKDPTVGNDILLAGLACQTAAFATFLALFAGFVVIMIAQRKHYARPAIMQRVAFVTALGVASALVFLRTIFRLIETSQGVFGHLTTHEAFFGCLEFAPIIAAVTILAIWYPGRWDKAEVLQHVEVGESQEKVVWT